VVLLQNQLKDRIEVVRDYTGDVFAHASAGPIRQVVMNLLVNAVQAIEGTGKITIHTSRSDSEVSLSITDTGTGIPPEIRERIFDPFFTTKRVGEGTGLGLSIVHTIVGTFGGSVAVESVVGSGTAFTLTFPRSEHVPEIDVEPG
jgi:signal transduction histidine kinase